MINLVPKECPVCYSVVTDYRCQGCQREFSNKDTVMRKSKRNNAWVLKFKDGEIHHLRGHVRYKYSYQRIKKGLDRDTNF